MNFKKSQVNQDQHSPDDQEALDDDQNTAKALCFEPAAKKKPRSEKQRQASRHNGALSHGPNNTERTRYNAMKHGLCAEGLTPLDNAEEYQHNLRDLRVRYSYSSPYIKFLTTQQARDMVRSQRIDQLEAQYITALSNPSQGSTTTIEPALMKEYIVPVLGKLQRYGTAALKSVIRCQRELDRVTQGGTSLANCDIDIETGDVTI